MEYGAAGLRVEGPFKQAVALTTQIDESDHWRRLDVLGESRPMY